mmetsp:Transcript_102678/g.314065  ORF Transcript_102678/g.314065 Transcript_102678/m.314065 type:complete len:214 (+) Transcript_102678:990-1631(+)
MQPGGDHRIVGGPDVLLEVLVLQSQLRQRAAALPRFVSVLPILLADEKPVPGLCVWICQCLHEEVAADAHVVEDAVQNQVHASRVDRLLQRVEVFHRAVRLVDLEIIGCVVLVHGIRLEDRLQVQDIAHGLDVVELREDPLQIPTVKRKLVGVVLCLLVLHAQSHRLGPLMNRLRRLVDLLELRQRLVGRREPVNVYLVDQAAHVPVGVSGGH